MSRKLKELEQRKHVLQRPYMYIGKCDQLTKKKMTLNNSLTFETVKLTYSPLLLKLFDEAITNATDNALLKLTKLITISIFDESIKIKNDGENFEIKKEESPVDHVLRYIPETAFSRFNSSGNYDDDIKRNYNGVNGVGIKLVNVFSKLFKLNIVSKNKHYIQTFKNSLEIIEPPEISETSESDYVEIEFYPDFKIPLLKGITIFQHIPLLLKRIYEASLICKIKLNIDTEKLKLKHVFNKIEPFEFYKNYLSSFNSSVSSDDAFKFNSQISDDISFQIYFNVVPNKGKILTYVNYIETPDNGTHYKFIMKQLKELYQKKYKTELNTNYIMGYINILIPNPTFDSQAKTRLSNKIEPKNINPSFTKFINNFVLNSGINNIKKKTRKTNSKVLIEKLIDAEDAIKQDGSCILFICEGNSAAGMVDNAFKYLSHQKYGRYALTGKILNVAKNTVDKTKLNKVISELCQSIGLEIGQKYDSTSNLRYGKVICVKDADTDGSDIMGLCINLFYEHFKELLELDFFYEFITPVLQIHDNKICKEVKYENKKKKRNDNDIIPLEFYSFPEYEEYLKTNNYTPKKDSITYLKGLASITVQDAARYFQNFDKYLIRISPDETSDEYMNLAFGKKQEDNRKKWVERCTPTTYLPRDPNKDVLISDFIERDLVCFAYDDCSRSLINVIDGLKTSQRKILYTILHTSKPYLKRKVFELAAETTQFSTYLHGDMSLNEAIFGMMNDFTESNNLPLLSYDGQIGHRGDGGKYHGASRYVYVKLNKITRFIFPKEDDVLLKQVVIEGKSCEPYYYIPIIPMSLINGALGIGTGFKCDIPIFDYNYIIDYLIEKLEFNLEKKKETLKNEEKKKEKSESDNEKETSKFSKPFNPNLLYPGFKGTFEEVYDKYGNLKGYNTFGIYEYIIPPKLTGRYKCEWIGQDKTNPFDYSSVFLKITEFPLGPTTMKENIRKKVVKLAKEQKEKVKEKPKETKTKFNPNIKIEDIIDNSISGQKQLGTHDEYELIIKISKPEGVLEDEIKEFVNKKIYSNKSFLSVNSMFCFNKDCQIRHFPTVQSIFTHYYNVRLDLYKQRKQKLLNDIYELIEKTSNKMKFIKLVVDGKIEIRKVKKSDLIESIKANGLLYPEELIKIETYKYTKEEIEKLKNEIKDLIDKYQTLSDTSIYKIWMDELIKLKEVLKENGY